MDTKKEEEELLPFGNGMSLKERAQHYIEEGLVSTDDIPLLRSVNLDEETQTYLDSIDPTIDMSDANTPAGEVGQVIEHDHIPYGQEFEEEPEPESSKLSLGDARQGMADFFAEMDEEDEVRKEHDRTMNEQLDAILNSEQVGEKPAEASALPSPDGYVNFANIQQGVEWESLSSNKDWIHATRLMFKTVYGVDMYDRNGNMPDYIKNILDEYGSKEDTIEQKIANYGLKEMSDFNFNLLQMSFDAKNLMSLGDSLEEIEQKKAFLYLMEQYDATNMSWKTTGDATLSVLSDPTTWLGFVTLGAGTLASFTGKKVLGKTTVEAIKANLRKGIRNSSASLGLNTTGKRLTGLAAFEGAAHMGYFDNTKQNVVLDVEASSFGLTGEDKEAYVDEFYSKGQTATMMGFGAVGAGVLSAGMRKGMSYLGNRSLEKRIKKIEERHSAEIADHLTDMMNVMANRPKSVIAQMIEKDVPIEDIIKFAKQEVRKVEGGDELIVRADEVLEEVVESVAYSAPTLPQKLKGSKPNYNYGGSKIELEFEDDVARVLFQMGSKTKSKHYVAYRAFLEKAGIKDIDAQAAKIRQAIKTDAAAGQAKVKVSYDKPVAVEKTVKKIKKQETPEPPKAAKVEKIGEKKWKVEGEDKVYRTKKAATEAAEQAAKSAAAKQDPRPYALDDEEFVMNMMDVIKRIIHNPSSVDEVIATLDNSLLSMRQTEKLSSMVSETGERLYLEWLKLETKLMDDSLTDVERASVLTANMDALEKLNKAREVAEHVHAYAGRTLQDIQNWIAWKTSKDGTAPTAEAIEAAHIKHFQHVITKAHKAYEERINKAIQEADWDGLWKLQKERDTSDEVMAAFKGLDNIDPKHAQKFRIDENPNATFGEKFLEMSIAGFFSHMTIAYNTIIPSLKTITIPALDTIAQNPLELMAWRKGLYQYSYMLSAQKSAFNAGKMAQNIEHTPLTADDAKFYEGGVKNKGKGWKFGRMFPRLVAFSDSYLSESIAYTHLVAKHMDELVSEGVEQGMNGKQLKAHIDANLDARVQSGFDRKLTYESIKPLLVAANNLGLKGADAEAWVTKELKKSGAVEALKKLTDVDTTAFVNELIYKTPWDRPYKDAKGMKHYQYDFSLNPTKGNNIRALSERTEEAAAVWDDIVKRNPYLRLVTTPFWRTPVWLVREAARLTPAVNALLPTFMDDLAGVNGTQAKARATTEAAFGYAYLTWGLSKWAMNEAKGGEHWDYTKQATASDNDDELKALHIEIWGIKTPFRRMEPMKFPLQFMFDSLEKHHVRQKKIGLGVGYGTNKELEESFMSSMGIALAAFVQTIRDTGLLTGAVDTVDSALKIGGALQEEDNLKEPAMEFFKWFTDKATAPIPSIISRVQTGLGDDEKVSASNPWHIILRKFDPNHEELPRRYGWDSVVLKNPNPRESMIPYAPLQPSADKKSKEWKVVDKYLRNLEKLDYGSFTTPFLRWRQYFGNQDLRRVYVNAEGEDQRTGVAREFFGVDRKLSVYYLLHNQMRQLNKNEEYTKWLYGYATEDRPLGTPKAIKKSPRIEETKAVFTQWREDALTVLREKYPELDAMIHKEDQRQSAASQAN